MINLSITVTILGKFNFWYNKGVLLKILEHLCKDHGANQHVDIERNGHDVTSN